MKWMMAELKGICTRNWNYENPLVFTTFIIITMENVWYSKDIFLHLSQIMEILEKGSFAALVYDKIMSR